LIESYSPRLPLSSAPLAHEKRQSLHALAALVEWLASRIGSPEKRFTTETQNARRRKKVRFGEDFLCELP